MSKLVLAAAACLALLLLLINGVEPRHHHRGHHGGHHDGSPPAEKLLKLLVFGDEFADNGNHASDVEQGWFSRAWRYPYGMSDKAHGREPTGRFSNGLVQSDYVAKILGHRESPPAYSQSDDGMGASGMNFAVGGSYVLEEVAKGNGTLGDQVDELRSMMDDGLVERRDLRDSVALIAISGNDYADVREEMFEAMYGKAIEEIARVVTQLQDLGVSKVMVNALPPFGCSPWRANRTDYKSCDDAGNVGPDKYNAALRDRLGDADGVMLLDVNTALMDLAAPKQSSALSQQFTERLRPCCKGTGEHGYCGADTDGDHYLLCDHPDKYLYWDVVNPTQAGWRAIMQLLEGQITDFLGISTLNNL